MAGWQFCSILCRGISWPSLCGGSPELWTMAVVANCSEYSGHQVDNAGRTADRLAWELTHLVTSSSQSRHTVGSQCSRGVGCLGPAMADWGMRYEPCMICDAEVSTSSRSSRDQPPAQLPLVDGSNRANGGIFGQPLIILRQHYSTESYY